MGCGASNDTSGVQAPTLNKRSVLPAIVPTTKSSSAKSNGSSDSGIEDSEPPKCKLRCIDYINSDLFSFSKT
jgi:hypothetical protein